MSDDRQISLRIRGLDKNDGHVQLSAFIQQLDLLRKALTETDRIVSDKQSTDFNVVGLQHNSPASIVLAAVPSDVGYDQCREVLSKFFRSFTDILAGTAPVDFDFHALQAFKNITSLLGKKVSELVVHCPNEKPIVLPPLASHIDNILGPDEYEYGSETGTLDQINVHNQNIFTIYPTLRGVPKLKCIFLPELRQEAIGAVDRYVRVEGEKKFKSHFRSRNPYEMVVQKIEVYPPEEELPTIESLRGIIQDSNSQLSSEEEIRRIRNEW